jgi:protein SCO1
MGMDAQAVQQRRLIATGVLVSVIFLLGIGALLVFRAQLTASALTPTATAAISNGVTVIDPARALVDFSLPSREGEPLALSDLRGKYTLMFFGYTHCPDVCPLTLAEFREVKELMGEDAADVEFLFVSVDGERDSPEVLAEFTARFDPAFRFMQGDAVTLEAIGADYGLFYELHNDDPAEANYLVDHTTYSYLVDPEGGLVALFAYGTEPEVMAEAIQKLEARG